jgi:hypothetical protein
LCNSHRIPSATEQESRRGIEAFAPVVLDAALAVLKADPDGLAELHTRHPADGRPHVLTLVSQRWA